jgi:hypothetical protein
MPEKFYREWMGVAREESEHYRLLAEHLADLGHCYGDFPAHDGLWEMAERTQEDVLARLALVPRTLEARGLDASPAVRHKLASGGDRRGAEIVDLILREIGLVIFTLASIYFFFLAKKPQLVSQNALVKKTSRSAFLLGLFISAINLFPIPYYVIVSIALASYGLFGFQTAEIYGLVLGILLGSLTVFYAYVVVFNRLRSKTDYLIRNMNVIMGSITAVVSMLTLYQVVKYYW